MLPDAQRRVLWQCEALHGFAGEALNLSIVRASTMCFSRPGTCCGHAHYIDLRCRRCRATWRSLQAAQDDALLPWVAALQRSVVELRNVLVEVNANRWELEVRLSSYRQGLSSMACAAQLHHGCRLQQPKAVQQPRMQRLPGKCFATTHG